MSAPKKYIKVGGVMKMNPEYKKWEAAKNGTAPPPPSNAPNMQLPVVCSMDDHMQMNDDLGLNIPLSESTNATIEMMQEPEICMEAGMQADTMVDELGAVLGKYEVPMGLMNKVCLQRCMRSVRGLPCAVVSIITILSLTFLTCLLSYSNTLHPLHYSS
jgi:hypothetical protein